MLGYLHVHGIMCWSCWSHSILVGPLWCTYYAWWHYWTTLLHTYMYKTPHIEYMYVWCGVRCVLLTLSKSFFSLKTWTTLILDWSTSPDITRLRARTFRSSSLIRREGHDKYNHLHCTCTVSSLDYTSCMSITAATKVSQPYTCSSYMYMYM